jgi:hypothetical protein
LQVLMSQGFKIATELATCRVPEDRTSPARAEGYMVAFAVFYEGGGGFRVPSHQFFHSLLQ